MIDKRIREKSKSMYLDGIPFRDIAKKFRLKEGTVRAWKLRDNWDAAKLALDALKDLQEANTLEVAVEQVQDTEPETENEPDPTTPVDTPDDYEEITSEAIVRSLPRLEILAKLEPHLNIEVTIERTSKVTQNIHRVNECLIKRLRHQIEVWEHDEINWKEFGILLETASRVSRATLEQEMYLYSLAVNRATDITRQMTLEELEAIPISA